MGKGINIFVGNLSYSTSEETLAAYFAPYGEIEHAKVIVDRETGCSRGFGFVSMADREQGKAAIAALNGTQLDGRSLKINEAKPRTARQ